jgi:dTDP-4-dehydrorhamnose 3,5-epimerase-like enzyme
MNLKIPIMGLKWLKRVRLDNGGMSFVVPFPDTHSVNIVDHGFSMFNYGQYGIHIGQADVLTFLGDNEHMVTAHFIDCRAQSETWGVRYSENFYPSTAWSLFIPPGVAHTFDGLGGIYTVNNYQLYLPDPDKVFQAQPDWSPENDILNIPVGIQDSDIPRVTPMHHLAGTALYKAISDYHRNHLKHLRYMHPERQVFQLNSGESVSLTLRKKVKETSQSTEYKKNDLGIAGLFFEKIPSIQTGEHSKIVPILYGCPFYIVDHGARKYDFNTYGLHKGQEDNLIFLGNPQKKIRAEFVDFRAGSPTLHKKIQLEFTPSSSQKLVIPPGVAHAFWGLEDVFTLNRPRLFLNDRETYIPAHDTHDWPIENHNYPTMQCNTILAPEDYYEYLKSRQKNAFSKDITQSTPTSFMTKNKAGKKIRVLLRKISAKK